jgi:hypothetical protein
MMSNVISHCNRSIKSSITDFVIAFLVLTGVAFTAEIRIIRGVTFRDSVAYGMKSGLEYKNCEVNYGWVVENGDIWVITKSINREDVRKDEHFKQYDVVVPIERSGAIEMYNRANKMQWEKVYNYPPSYDVDSDGEFTVFMASNSNVVVVIHQYYDLSSSNASSIYAYNYDGTELLKISYSEYEIYRIYSRVISPNGKYLAFAISTLQGEKALLVNIETGKRTILEFKGVIARVDDVGDVVLYNSGANSYETVNISQD